MPRLGVRRRPRRRDRPSRRPREGVRRRRRLARRAPGSRVARQLPSQDASHRDPRGPVLRPGSLPREGEGAHRVRRRRRLQRHVLPLQRRRQSRAHRRAGVPFTAVEWNQTEACGLRPPLATPPDGAASVGVDRRRVRPEGATTGTRGVRPLIASGGLDAKLAACSRRVRDAEPRERRQRLRRRGPEESNNGRVRKPPPTARPRR